jgi:uncharacterized membrane protein YvbJ
MFCTQCGANNADNAVVCTQCGRNLRGAGSTPLQATGVVLPPGTAASGIAIQNYLVFAILATVFCCLPAGIPAIVYAAQVNGKLAAGDLAGAQKASDNAKMWCWISFGLGVAVTALSVLLFMAGAIGGMHPH